MSNWAKLVIRSTKSALSPHVDHARAEGAGNYMKHIAPFIGIATPERRAFTKAAWSVLTDPTSDELGEAAIALFALTEREYHYAAYDLIARYISAADEYFLAEFLEPLLTTKSWWDTVDSLVTAGVSPLCRRYDATKIIDEWSESGNIWLIRAAIGHQRGWKSETDVSRVLELCDRHWTNKEFFVAKAIGWALRDLTSIEAPAVRRFLRTHTTKNNVAHREAMRGLNRCSQ
jgi:3-methyladenine DNA glycosylase AlkD